MPSTRTIFAALCLLGIVAIAVGAGLEVARQRRGGELVSRSQFRLRLISALVWIISLATFFYAVTWLWPLGGAALAASPLAKVQAKRFLLLVLGAMMLLLFGLFLLMLDVWQTAHTRRVVQSRTVAKRANLARDEARELNKEI